MPQQTSYCAYYTWKCHRRRAHDLYLVTVEEARDPICKSRRSGTKAGYKLLSDGHVQDCMMHCVKDMSCTLLRFKMSPLGRFKTDDNKQTYKKMDFALEKESKYMLYLSRYTTISIYVVGSKLQAYKTRKTEREYGILMNNYQQN